MKLHTRADWGATGPGHGTTIATPVELLILHHSVTGDPGIIDGVQLIELIHRERFGTGIGYQVVYSPRDRAAAIGRNFGRSGAHTAGHNTVGHAVCVLGNFDTDRPPAHVVEDLARIAARHGRDGHGPGRFTGGHRDYSPTACPGRHLHPLIAQINRRATTATPAPDPTEEYAVTGITPAQLRTILREEVERAPTSDPHVRQRLNENVRLSEAACAGAVAAIRQQLGMPPDPASDYIHVRRIRQTPNQGYTLATVRDRLEQAAGDHTVDPDGEEG